MMARMGPLYCYKHYLLTSFDTNQHTLRHESFDSENNLKKAAKELIQVSYTVLMLCYSYASLLYRLVM